MTKMSEDEPKDPTIVSFGEFKRRKDIQGAEAAKRYEDAQEMREQVSQYIEVLAQDLDHARQSLEDLKDAKNDGVEPTAKYIERLERQIRVLTDAVTSGRNLILRPDVSRQELSEFVSSVNSKLI